MTGALVSRCGRLLLVILCVTSFTALLIDLLPGDPVDVIVPFATDEQRQQLRNDLNLDDPLPTRYAHWVAGLATGDLGNYYGVSTQRPVADAVKSALPVSLLLMAYSQIVALAVAIPLGVFAAARAGSRADRALNATAFALLAVPSFVVALVLAYYVGVRWGALPVSGYTSPGDGVGEHLRRMVLPAVALAVGQIAVYLRLLRSDMIATLQEDYITMAKAQGLSRSRILWRHAFRPASLTLLTVAALNVGALIGGAVIIEVIFQLPGMGMLIFQAVQERQYVALQSLVAIVAIAYVLVNFAVDSAYGRLDPRLRNDR